VINRLMKIIAIKCSYRVFIPHGHTTQASSVVLNISLGIGLILKDWVSNTLFSKLPQNNLKFHSTVNIMTFVPKVGYMKFI